MKILDNLNPNSFYHKTGLPILPLATNDQIIISLNKLINAIHCHLMAVDVKVINIKSKPIKGKIEVFTVRCETISRETFWTVL